MNAKLIETIISIANQVIDHVKERNYTSQSEDRLTKFVSALEELLNNGESTFFLSHDMPRAQKTWDIECRQLDVKPIVTPLHTYSGITCALLFSAFEKLTRTNDVMNDPGVTDLFMIKIAMRSIPYERITRKLAAEGKLPPPTPGANFNLNDNGAYLKPSFPIGGM